MSLNMTAVNRITWRELKASLPPGTKLTSCYRSSQEQLDFIAKSARAHGYQFRTEPAVGNPASWKGAHAFVRKLGYKVAAPGHSAHEQGIAYDFSGPDLTAIEAALRKLVAAKRIRLANGSKSALLLEPQNHCVHAEITQVILYNDFAEYETA